MLNGRQKATAKKIGYVVAGVLAAAFLPAKLNPAVMAQRVWAKLTGGI